MATALPPRVKPQGFRPSIKRQTSLSPYSTSWSSRFTACRKEYGVVVEEDLLMLILSSGMQLAFILRISEIFRILSFGSLMRKVSP